MKACGLPRSELFAGLEILKAGAHLETPLFPRRDVDYWS